MAVVSTREIWRGRSGSFRGVSAYELTRVFRVITNATTDDPTTILAAGVLPDMYVADTLSPALTVRGYGFSHPEDSPLIWEVSVEYSSAPPDLPGGNPPGGENPDPLSRTPRLSWTTQDRERIVIEDALTGDKILNSAGDEYETPVLADDGRLIAHIAVNVDGVPDDLPSWNNKTNESAITIGGLLVSNNCGLYKFRGLSDRKVENGTSYYEFTYEVHINPDDWNRKLVDLGYYEISPGAGRRAIETAPGVLATTPQLLNGAGLWLGPSATAASAVIHPPSGWRVYGQFDFNELPGLPS